MKVSIGKADQSERRATEVELPPKLSISKVSSLFKLSVCEIGSLVTKAIAKRETGWKWTGAVETALRKVGFGVENYVIETGAIEKTGVVVITNVVEDSAIEMRAISENDISKFCTSMKSTMVKERFLIALAKLEINFGNESSAGNRD